MLRRAGNKEEGTKQGFQNRREDKKWNGLAPEIEVRDLWEEDWYEDCGGARAGEKCEPDYSGAYW